MARTRRWLLAPALALASALALALLCAVALATSAAGQQATPAGRAKKKALVVGSVNVDITIPLSRLPTREETITASEAATRVATGGKGANQAIALAKLSDPNEVEVEFVGVLRCDIHRDWNETQQASGRAFSRHWRMFVFFTFTSSKKIELPVSLLAFWCVCVCCGGLSYVVLPRPLE